MIIFIHLPNNASNYFRIKTGSKFNQKSPNILSNGAAVLSLFLEYA